MGARSPEFEITPDRVMRDEQADRLVLKYAPAGGAPFWIECVARAITPDASDYEVTVERIGKTAPVTLRLVTIPDDAYQIIVANIDDHLRHRGLEIGIYRGRGATRVRFTDPRALAVITAEPKPSP